MAADRTVDRSEALRRSMVALIEQGALNEAHPAYGAPFVVVGEGSVGLLTQAPIATSSIIPEPQASTLPGPQSRKGLAHDCSAEVGRAHPLGDDKCGDAEGCSSRSEASGSARSPRSVPRRGAIRETEK
jgi:hypothetical protein